ncbi:methionine--tRNA ligase [Candidatus Roizmanbacteria bacterium CG_4_9_14_0_2_um_filter_39_13]|uniref:Methionine--tRNA ligase n=2 Tax=Candidatus Roizmaniibacteriota TaxID=1752723 RepID=A0A2M8F2B0_9BACT|nr:MAG: methionine--tRNA ligase [Candidatus Roizmanbacteria bacterium CG_4_10_14_0_2_um_filter_39_12]PJC33417.1 MAG: methionine--tRNA ligase [Candidatus Roizmanbacteria bacterium CG_4_9_14_0_2_um_filter_39_13]PJE62238.1 MAG: methionine--tRNA ligase [Candidatus Roizmanbacteria bacterium CG10_big_fil_rev_8_21_14_0_10_39_12]
MKNKYITTAIPYVNGSPHIGHALEFVQADSLARYFKTILKEDTLLLSGSDENALKNVQAAEAAGKDVQSFVDENALKFEDLAKILDVQFDIFQKGSAKNHFIASQKLWNLCLENGDIYKDTYSGLYCVGCETFYDTDELNELGECFEHPGKHIEKVTEKNYYFKLSRYQEKLIHLISTDELKIAPDTKKNEVLSFLKEPLQDISISRTNERAKNWGVPVPGDDSQRMYVWFDALNIYQSGIGFGTDEEKYNTWWPADVHVIGKGIIRFHAVYWPAFLMSAGLKLPHALFAHGYLTVDGQKMSKSVGNVVDPFEIVKTYGIDPVRYYLLREIPTLGDGDYSDKRMRQLYDADLANELGNLLSRVTTLAAQDGIVIDKPKKHIIEENIQKEINEFRLNEALEAIWVHIKIINAEINDIAPWKLSKEERNKGLTRWLEKLYQIGLNLSPFIPDTSEKIMGATTGEIQKIKPLFPRLKK